jgi:hypothetical protein
MTSALGCGGWSAYAVGRGGSPVRVEIPYSSLDVSKVLNNWGTAGLRVGDKGSARGECCELFRAVEPWRDEILLYRDKDTAYVGPLMSMTATDDRGSFSSNDLFAWMEVRFIEEDFHGDGDVADIFRAIFDLALASDPSPNIDISTRQTGVQAVRNFKAQEFHRAADALRELARTGLDFTMDGRHLLAGGAEVFESQTPLILHDDGCKSAEVTIDGGAFATDVAVFGGTSVQQGASQDSRIVQATGRATTGIERYGLVQRSFTELFILDGISADANAAARLAASQPAAMRVRATLSPEAAFGWNDLICGRRFDVRLTKVAGCIEVAEMMRLVGFRVNVEAATNSEDIVVDLVPMGIAE